MLGLVTSNNSTFLLHVTAPVLPSPVKIDAFVDRKHSPTLNSGGVVKLRFQ